VAQETERNTKKWARSPWVFGFYLVCFAFHLAVLASFLFFCCFGLAEMAEKRLSVCSRELAIRD